MLFYLKGLFQHDGGVGVSAGFRDALIYGFGGVAWKIIGFLLIPLYTRYLTPSDYGIAELIIVAGGMFGYIVSQGMHSAMFRFHGLECKSFKDNKALINTSLIHRLVSSIFLYGLLIWGAEFVCQLIFNNSMHTELFKWMFVGCIFEQICEVGQTAARMLRKPIDFVLMSWIRMGVGLLANIYLIVYLNLGAKALIYSYAVSAGVGCITVFLWLRWKRLLQFRISVELLKRMLIYGLPLVPSFILSGLLLGLNKFFINYFWGEEEVGLYSMAFTFASITGLIYFEPLQRALTPLLFQAIKEKKSEVIRLHWYVMIGGLFVTTAICLMSIPGIKIMTTESFYPAAEIAPLICLIFLVRGVNVFASLGLRVVGKTWYVSYAVILGVLLTLFLNVLLIPTFGGRGAAASITLGALCEILLLHWFSAKFYPIPYDYSTLAIPVAGAGIIFFLSSLIEQENLMAMVGFRIVLLSVFLSWLIYYCMKRDPGILEFWNSSKQKLFSAQ